MSSARDLPSVPRGPMWFHTWWHLSPLILIPAATKLQTPDATTRGVPVMEWSVWALGPVTVPTWMSTRCVKMALNLDVHQSSQHTGTVFVSVPYSLLCMMSPQHLPELLEEFFFYRALYFSPTISGVQRTFLTFMQCFKLPSSLMRGFLIVHNYELSLSR